MAESGMGAAFKGLNNAFNRVSARYEGREVVKEARKARKYAQMELIQDLKMLKEQNRYMEDSAVVQLAQTGVKLDSGTARNFMQDMRQINQRNYQQTRWEGLLSAKQISDDAHKLKWDLYEQASIQNAESWGGGATIGTDPEVSADGNWWQDTANRGSGDYDPGGYLDFSNTSMYASGEFSSGMGDAYVGEVSSAPRLDGGSYRSYQSNTFDSSSWTGNSSYSNFGGTY